MGKFLIQFILTRLYHIMCNINQILCVGDLLHMRTRCQYGWVGHSL